MTLTFPEIAGKPTLGHFCSNERVEPHKYHDPRLTGRVKSRKMSIDFYVQYEYKCPCWWKPQWSIYAGPTLLWSEVHCLGSGRLSPHNPMEQCVPKWSKLMPGTNGYEALIARVDAQIDRLMADKLSYEQAYEAELERKAIFGVDSDYEVGTVLLFKKRFSPGEKVYDYAVIKTYADGWYTSGPRSPGPYTFEALLKFIDHSFPVSIVTEVEDLS